MAPRTVLVTGATGKQGGALIRALLQPTISDPPTHEYFVYALTRKASSPSATHLAAQKNVTVVEADLDDRDSIYQIFRDAKANGGIWGVFVALSYPGLGVQADGEERQGKMLADLALEFGVKAYIYSSLARSGPQYEDELKLSPRAKANIEQHCQLLGNNGLPWTILRPGFFMENLNGFIGSIGVSVLKSGLKPDTNIGLIASEDIGNVAAAVFKDHETYKFKILSLYAEFITMGQLEQEYKRATRQTIPSVPSVFAWILIKINGGTQMLIEGIEQVQHARLYGLYPELDTEIQIAKDAYPMQSYYAWVLKGRVNAPIKSGWNNLSIWKLVSGQS